MLLTREIQEKFNRNRKIKRRGRGILFGSERNFRVVKFL